jgi:hypothetical protein
MKKIIVRIKGGLGNQLFCYAAARRLALVNNAELVIDDITGFARDRQFRRDYALDHFHIQALKATSSERLEPFERYRRGVMKWLSRRKPFAERHYLEQEGLDFDERLLALKVIGPLYLDGYWQSEGYFKDVEHTIREDLQIVPPTDEQNQRMAEVIRNSQAVALHVRWFEAPDRAGSHNASADYYQRAIALMDEKIDSPHYFLFSDDPVAARAKFVLPEGRVTFVSHNRGDENAYADLWLITQCRHVITANSTFSWWGAWLNPNEDKIVIAPKRWFANQTDVLDLFPQSWVTL